MSLSTKFALAFVALALVVGGAVALASYERGVGRAQQQQVDAAQAAHVAQIAVVKAETVLVARVDTFTRWRTKLVPVRDMLLKHLTDTVLVKQYVRAADSTIRACSDVILSCDTVRARYRALVSKDSTLAAIAKPDNGFFSHWKKSVGGSIVYGLDDHKLHAGPGFQFGYTW